MLKGENLLSQATLSPQRMAGFGRDNGLLLSLIVVSFDQSAKYFALRFLTLYQPFPLTSFFNLTLAHNTGAAFILFSDTQHGVLFLSAFAIAMSIFILIWLLRLPQSNTGLRLALSLILGGALGNLGDRIHYGYVIDFIDLYIDQWHWPAFNIADAAICVGISILAFTCIKKE